MQLKLMQEHHRTHLLVSSVLHILCIFLSMPQEEIHHSSSQYPQQPPLPGSSRYLSTTCLAPFIYFRGSSSEACYPRGGFCIALPVPLDDVRISHWHSTNRRRATIRSLCHQQRKRCWLIRAVSTMRSLTWATRAVYPLE